MAEFCLECYNRIFGTEYSKFDVELTPTLELCEGCAQMKRVVVWRRPPMLADFFVHSIRMHGACFWFYTTSILVFFKCIKKIKKRFK